MRVSVTTDVHATMRMPHGTVCTSVPIAFSGAITSIVYTALAAAQATPSPWQSACNLNLHTWRAGRNTDEWHRLQWAQAEDEIGQQMLALFRDANALRRTYPALRRGGVSILHEVRQSCGGVAPCCNRGFVGVCGAR